MKRTNNKWIISRLLMAIMQCHLMLIAIFFFNFSYSESAIASRLAYGEIATIQQQEETTGQILYSSRHKLRDNQGNTWQIVLFKRVKNNQTQEIDLRLVGFPQLFQFVHPGNLIIVIDDRQVFSASDRFAEKSPSPNVGEFDIQEIISSIPLNRSVKLVLPLTAENPVEIVLPSPVILEWQELAKS